MDMSIEPWSMSIEEDVEEAISMVLDELAWFIWSLAIELVLEDISISMSMLIEDAIELAMELTIALVADITIDVTLALLSMAIEAIIAEWS